MALGILGVAALLKGFIVDHKMVFSSQGKGRDVFVILAGLLFFGFLFLIYAFGGHALVKRVFRRGRNKGLTK